LFHPRSSFNESMHIMVALLFVMFCKPALITGKRARTPSDPCACRLVVRCSADGMIMIPLQYVIESDPSVRRQFIPLAG
jgi:hypothetical protein